MTNEKNIIKLEKRLAAYEQAINRIDDYFEYRHESELDKGYVRGVLESLTNKLKSIYHYENYI